MLSIDNQKRAQGASPEGTLAVTEYMYFGGYPGQHKFMQVTNRGFEGCLDEIYLGDDLVDLRTAVDMRETVAGCPSSPVHLVASFFGDGFIKVDNGEAVSDGNVHLQSL